MQRVREDLARQDGFSLTNINLKELRELGDLLDEI